ncbi:MAG: hypothetical protein VB021_09750 [Oscillospiraceae bacterium]|nr:hypothetical protein [Oscillospiraceae bacterium]
MGIPIVVGVTGHRDLRERDLPQLRELVTAELKKLTAQYPHSDFVLLDSLAAGADALCAEAALALGMTLVCPLPLPAREYRRDFSESEAAVFDALLKRAGDVFAAPAAELLPEDPSRDFYYRQAGIYVASHSHVLLALWDGAPAQPGGCGTAETVDFMLRGDFDGGGFRAANDGAVIHIPTPRQADAADAPLMLRLLENEKGSLRDVLRRTDEFNADEKSAGAAAGDALLPEAILSRADGRIKKLHGLYRSADRLALRCRQRYLRAMRWFSAFGVLLVACFLLYDELECNLFLLCYGALILTYALAFAFVRKGRAHEKYLQYRVLSETLRAQFYLTAAGLCDNAGGCFTWTQKQEVTWVKEAVTALLIGKPAAAAASDAAVKEAWIDGQLAYHRRAQGRDAGKHRLRERVSGCLLAASVALFALVLALEFFRAPAMAAPVFGGRFPALFLHHPEQSFALRSLMKILLGGVSAVAVFLTNYYGKLSFERKSADHERMAALYACAKERFESGKADNKALMRALAREEIIENGNWFSYCKENPPSFSV